MTDRVRVYLSGLLHGAACLWVVGWALSHREAAPGGVFGPAGWLPVPVALTLVLLGALLLHGGRAPRAPG
jgi:hypothetical protein